jgi:hypothetical protein
MSDEIKVFQTCDKENYRELLDISVRSSEIYCQRFDIKFEKFIGIKRGYFPWHACFNRIIYLKEQLDSGFTGWIFYLDADTCIFDHSLDVRELLGSYDGDFLFAPGGLTGKKWDVNDGVFLINLGSDAGKRLIVAWYDNFMATPDDALREAAVWESLKSDQPRLHDILRENPDLLARLAILPREVFNNEYASFVRQVLRSNVATMEERVARLRADVDEALRYRLSSSTPHSAADSASQPD